MKLECHLSWFVNVTEVLHGKSSDCCLTDYMPNPCIPGQTKRGVFVTPLRSCVKVAVLDHSQPLHLESLVVRDGHPGGHLGEARV